MKKVFFIGMFMAVLGFSTLANAAYFNNGNGLIYDSDQNITWYNYTNGDVIANENKNGTSWQTQMDWAATLAVTDVNGNTITGWRLPTTPGTYGIPGDASTFNLTEGEMGVLFLGLGNTPYDWDGKDYHELQRGLFTSLKTDGGYWTGKIWSEEAPMYKWGFGFHNGFQDADVDFNDWDYGPGSLYTYAIAVHDGNVGTKVPEPATMLLFSLGLLGLAGVRRKFKK